MSAERLQEYNQQLQLKPLTKKKLHELSAESLHNIKKIPFSGSPD